VQNDVTELGAVLEPGIKTGLNITFGEWCEFMGRTFYVLYWLRLADLGQVSAIDNFGVSPFPNIFVNETL